MTVVQPRRSQNFHMENNYPLLADRIKSTLIDTILILLLTFLAANLLDRASNPPDWVRISIFIGLWIVYEPLCSIPARRAIHDLGAGSVMVKA